ncbi:MAG: MBL fold metallo-hydrolase [Clostridiales bacterium]|nr:MBL fold metallo-hydrolase [Clostridiales bacterium]
MGYRAEKQKTERKGKILKRILLGILLFCIVALSIFSAIVPPVTWKYHVKLPKIPRRGIGELRIHFIDVGQGDSTLIEFPDGKVMLIDGGNGSKTTEKMILRRLNALDIDVIDYLVVTHTDVDHCGGLNEVIKYKVVRNAFLPHTEVAEGSEYERLFHTLTKSNCAWTYTSSKVENITSDSELYPYHVAFLYPHVSDVDESLGSDEGGLQGSENDSSSVLYLEYAGIRTLFTGDISHEIETKLVESDKLDLYEKVGASLQELDLLKVSHHGSKDASCLEFIEYTSPKTAVISCGLNNIYGNPSPVVLGRLSDVGAQVYRTDVQGSIMITISNSGVSYAVWGV